METQGEPAMAFDEHRQELERVLRSAQFRRAPKLQKFLGLTCEYYFQDRAESINEYLLAVEVFGKGPGFEPSEDSLVRVQAREVRRRLREYYQNEGKTSQLVLDMPVGGYVPVFLAQSLPAVIPPPPPAPEKRSLPARASWLMLAATVVVCVAMLFAADHERRLLLLEGTASASSGKQAEGMNHHLDGIWKRFLGSSVPTMLVVGSPDLEGCVQKKRGTPGCADEYTGMGEAVAVHLISNLYKAARQTLIVRQSRFVRADEASRHNLVLLGGKFTNEWTKQLGDDLSLNTPPDLPDAGTQYTTVFDSRSGQIARDRGIIAVRKHPESGHWVMILYGRHSYGTRAAAEAATDGTFLSQVKWPVSIRPFPERFRVLVNVNVNNGVSESPTLIAARVH